MKSKLVSFVLFAAGFFPAMCQAYPQIDSVVPTAGAPLKVYRDHDDPNQFWYIPTSIEPWSRDDTYKSSLYETDKVLSFVFRGQASVEEKDLEKVADVNGVSINNFSPIAYEYSKNVECEDFYSSTDVQWLFPSMIGNYLEVVPVSLRTTNPDLIQEIGSHLKDGGLACTVEVGFKANATAYDVTFSTDLDRVYHKFQADLHAEYFIFEADIATTIQSLVTDGTITIKVTQDSTLAQSEIDKQQQAAMNSIETTIIQQLFTPELKLPDGDLVGRGKPFSLRASWASSEEHKNYKLHIQGSDVVIKDSQIGIRLAIQ
jgi:hypothetical protein